MGAYTIEGRRTTTNTAFEYDRYGCAIRGYANVALTKGELVYVNGYDATGNVPKVSKAAGGSVNTLAQYVAAENIDADEIGWLVREGELSGLNTAGAAAVGSDAFLSDTEGDFGWLAGTNRQVTGQCTVKHASTGRIRFSLPGFLPVAGTVTASSTAMADGTVANPGLSFGTDPDCGIYRIGANNWALGAGGTKILDIDASGLEINGTFGVSGVTSLAAGAVAAPGLYLATDSNTGLYQIGADNLGVACNGSKVLDIGTGGLGVVGVLLLGNGAVNAPAFAFTADTNSGIYRIGADNIGVSVNGSKVLDVAATGLSVTGALAATTLINAANGEAAAPSITFTADTDLGLYRVGADALGVAANGALAATFGTTGLILVEDLFIPTTKGIKTGATTAAHTYALYAYDNDQAAWDALITLTNNNTPTLALAADGGISIANDVTLSNGVALQTTTTNGHTLTLKARDVDGGAYDALITLTNSNTPTLTLQADGGITVNAAVSFSDAAGTGAASLTSIAGQNLTLACGNDLVIQTGSAASDLLKLQARDTTGGGAWDDVVTITAGETPTIAIAADGGITLSSATALSDDLTVANGKAIKTSTTDGQTMVLQVYDNDTGPAYIDALTFTNGNTPALTLGIDLTVGDAKNIILDTGTGTQIGTAAGQKLGLWGATPVAQQTAAVAEAAFVENAGGTAVNVDSTFGGYTLQKVVQALQNIGILD